MKKRTVKVKLGMRRSYFAPIVSEPENAHPVYGPVLDMGEAVLGHLAVTYSSGDVHGNDRNKLHLELFTSYQLDAETTCDDLELSAAVYGRRYVDGMETSHMDDAPPYGGYGYIEPFIKADKSVVFRAVALYKLTAMLSQEKDDSDTRKNDFNPVMNAVSYSGVADNTGDWRDRKEFPSEAEADAWLMGVFGGAVAHTVRVTVTGTGAVTPPGVSLVQDGQDAVLTLSAAPTALYDNSVLMTDAVAEGLTYTIEGVNADHDVLVIFPV